MNKYHQKCNRKRRPKYHGWKVLLKSAPSTPFVYTYDPFKIDFLWHFGWRFRWNFMQLNAALNPRLDGRRHCRSKRWVRALGLAAPLPSFHRQRPSLESSCTAYSWRKLLPLFHQLLLRAKGYGWIVSKRKPFLFVLLLTPVYRGFHYQNHRFRLQGRHYFRKRRMYYTGWRSMFMFKLKLV